MPPVSAVVGATASPSKTASPKNSRPVHVRSFSEAVAGQYSAQPDVFGALPFRVRDLWKWIVCFCALDFNVDIGPEFECIYPPVNFSEQDLKTICFSSFPEQSYSENALTFHTFRFKPTSNLQLPSSAFSPILSQSPFPNEGYLYGYVVFQQRKDTSRVRHYSQKSLALISPFEFPALFELVVRKAAKYCFGPVLVPTLQTAAGHIACWPDPEAVMTKFNAAGNGKRKGLDLAYLGDKIRVLVSSDPLLPLADFVGNDSDVYLFGKVGSWGTLVKELVDVAELYTMYELVMLGQSVAVLANTPSMCSKLVSNVVDLIKPIPYTGLVRDYITMYSDIESLNIISANPVPGVIGFTNPFLAQMVNECEGAVSLVDISTHHATRRSSSLNVSLLPILLDLMPVTAAPQPMTLDLLYPVTATVDWQRRSLKKMFRTFGMTKSRSSSARRSRYLARDRQFLKTLRQMLADDASCVKIDKYIRLYFANLTAKILAPIKRYLYVARISPRQFTYAEFMYYLNQTNTRSPSPSLHTGHGGVGPDNRGALSLFGNMTLLTSSLATASPARTASPAESDSASDTSSPAPSPLSSSITSASSASTAPAHEDNIAADLYREAVMPDKGVFVDHGAAAEFYGLLLRSANFEAWCFV
ncbi:hypothetical protein V1517DRAFT_272801 [Lipomyces orientalis]|uniref:Uncharacterized protein n=1 Tax=Lipomyces orientalis TaxID=1233043 RepID=A0ACC3TS38_9ASCO